jgi:hypothetical protein
LYLDKYNVRNGRMRVLKWAFCAAGLLAGSIAPASAGLQVIGSGISGNYSVADGTTLWSLLGGVTTPVAPGENGKNAILHNYVVAHGGDGSISVFSIGEIDPSFGGTNLAPYIEASGGAYTLIDPNAGASGRDLAGLTSLQVIAVPALPTGPGGQSASLNLSGHVSAPGKYTLSDLENDFTPVHETVSGDTYTGANLFDFLDPSGIAPTGGIVSVGATDGYLVVFSLAELDPALGGDPDILLPYADTGSNFPADALARTLLPLDNKHGRWSSNIDSIQVAAVPELPGWSLMLIGFAGLGLIAARRRVA